MLPGLKTASLWAGLLVCVQLLPACGSPEDDTSELEWARSRSNSSRYAYLWNSDLQDDFLLGISVIKTANFPSNALNMVVRPLTVRLALTSGNKKLSVTEKASGESILAFNVGVYNRKYEIDFSSAGNDLTLKSLIATAGGQFTAESADGYWVSTGNPSVTGISQDADTVVVDLLHTVRLAKVARDWLGRTYIREYLTEKAGQVTVRMFLIRKKRLPQVGSGSVRTVAAARSAGLGFFASDFMADDAKEPTLPIQRMALGNAKSAGTTLTYYLKDFPSEFEATAASAIESWNIAFSKQAFKAVRAPAHIDAGDPRYHVVKWFDGTDKNLRWAGVAKMISNPDDGMVLGGTVYIQGDTLVSLYKDLTSYTTAASRGPLKRLEGSIGGISFDRDEGETPVIPFFTDPSLDFNQYMQGYYQETIAHEVGHILGLRHNFRGSTQLDARGSSASVMDYTPRAHRVHYKGPGTYDVAAVRWAYFGEQPQGKLPFCTDEDIDRLWDCSQGDFGEPVDYVSRGLIDGTMLLAQKPVPVTDDVMISSMQGMLETAYKMMHLKAQAPATAQAAINRSLAAAIGYVSSAAPDPDLSGQDKSTVEANLTRLRDLARKAQETARSKGWR